MLKFSRFGMTSLDVKLMTKDQYLGFQRGPRPEQSDQRQPDQAASFSHKAEALRDLASVASRLRFPTGTGTKLVPAPSPLLSRPNSQGTLCHLSPKGEATMAEDQIPLNFYAHLRQEPDQSFTIVVEISGIPSVELADRVSKWLQTAIRQNADMLGDVDTPPRRH